MRSYNIIQIWTSTFFDGVHKYKFKCLNGSVDNEEWEEIHYINWISLERKMLEAHNYAEPEGIVVEEMNSALVAAVHLIHSRIGLRIKVTGLWRNLYQGTRNLKTISTWSDGNCFSHFQSKTGYNTEHFMEIRMRVVTEEGFNKAKYLDKSNLSNGYSKM